MQSIVQSIPFKARRHGRVESWSLLARLQDFLRTRPSSRDTEQLPPHLQRDLGHAPPMAPRDIWFR